eukprot:1139414-Pelagomonas_calceolata.AAC.1
MENSYASHSQVLEPGASNNPPDPRWPFFFAALWWRRLTALLSQCVSFSLIDVGRVSSAYVVFLFLSFHLGVLLDHIYHIQICAPATVMSQFSGCEHVNESALCFSACAYANQDANT